MVDCNDFDNDNKDNDYDYELNEDGRMYKRIYNDEGDSEEDSLHTDNKSFALSIKQKSIITAVVGMLLFYWIISTTTFSDIMGIIVLLVLLCWIFF